MIKENIVALTRYGVIKEYGKKVSVIIPEEDEDERDVFFLIRNGEYRCYEEVSDASWKRLQTVLKSMMHDWQSYTKTNDPVDYNFTIIRLGNWANRPRFTDIPECLKR